MNELSAEDSGQATTDSGADDVLVIAINQVFALFRINYHNQFYSAFSDTQLLNQAKRLWLESLRHYSPEQILRSARQIIEESNYLPTLHRMITACDSAGAGFGLPPAREAYLEACNAASPKVAQPWSHPAVYHAGRGTGWYELANRAEDFTWPLFKAHYQRLCRQVIAGLVLDIDAPPALTDDGGQPLEKAERLQRLRALREQLDL
ncbi:MAG: replication protein P [Porticoccaceae bacterium]